MSEEELWTEYKNRPDDPIIIRALTDLMVGRGEEIPLDLAERSIALQRRELPEHPGLVTAHVSVLLKQGKPVPAELEELSLKQILSNDPENPQAIVALVALYLRTGAAVPPELEKKSLQLALAEHPGETRLLEALAAVEQKIASGDVANSPVPAPPAAATPAPPPAAPASAAAVVVRSIAKDTLQPPVAARLPVNDPSASVARELRNALAVRPADTYLMAQLIGVLLESGRITPATDLATVRGMMPPAVQTNPVVLSALLQAAFWNNAKIR